MKWTALAAITFAAAGAALLGGCDDDSATTKAARERPPMLDCGHGKAGSKSAFHQFAEILASGNETEIRAVLVDPPRFAWISAQGGAMGAKVSVRRNPGAAAAAVADRGGLPFQITRFYNVDPPGRTTDGGFRGLWDQARGFIGKGAIDCEQGKAIVLSLGVHRAR